MRFACDTGGTFTDLVVEDDAGALAMFKAPTTPHDPVEGILAAVAVAADAMAISLEDLLGAGEIFVHGTTHAINAIITGATARTAFLATQGHPDILVFREGGRLDPFNVNVPFPKPYIPRRLTFEVPERIAADGTVLDPLDDDDVIATLRRLSRLQIEAVAVCLLWSTVNPVHEDRVGALLAEHLPNVPYTLSHRLNPILREYRRASSAAIDASLKPMMSRYIGGLSQRLGHSGFNGRLLMLTSKGGVMDAADLAAAPIHAIGSGPSMAPIAGRHYCLAEAQSGTAIIADTGGTTYDVSLVRRGTIPMTPETWIGPRFLGHMVGFPSVDVKSIGAGGGSIAGVDEGGLLHVGPASAGAVPGPACYDKGGIRPTVTDASLVLGYIDPAFFLGGTMQLSPERAKEAIERDVGRPLGLGLHAAAAAILTLATENMVGAIEESTIHQGVDPRGTILVGGGGAAGLNSVAIARRLGCSKVIIPELGAALSAVGALISDLHADHRALFFTTTGDFDFDGANATLAKLEERCLAFIESAGAEAIDQMIEYHVEARYRAQIWELDVPLRSARIETREDVAQLRADFDRVHKEVFAYDDPGSDVEFVGWLGTARCRLTAQQVGQLRGSGPHVTNPVAWREAYFSGHGKTRTRIELFAAMKPDVTLTGPTIIESPFTTVVIDPGAQVARTAAGNLLITP